MSDREDIADIAALKIKVDNLTQNVQLLSTQVSTLVGAWNTATGLLTLVKKAAAVATALAALWALIHGDWTQLKK